MTKETPTESLAWRRPPHLVADGDAVHNPWAPEWNHPQHSSFWHEGDMTRCACGIFTPPALVPALAAAFPKGPTRWGLCSMTLENDEFNFVWCSPSSVDSRRVLMWEARSQHYIMFMRGAWSGPRLEAPTQNELLAKLAAWLLLS